MWLGEARLFDSMAIFKLNGRMKRKNKNFAGNNVKTLVLAGLLIGAAIVVYRYLVVTSVFSPSVYVIEESVLVPGSN